MSKSRSEADCCETAEACGLLLFSRLMSREPVVFRTEHESVARRMADIIASRCGIYVETTFPARADTGKGRYTVRIPQEHQRETVFKMFSGFMNDTVTVFLCEGCRKSFLRGAFLAAGTLNDPRKEYRLEFSAADTELCDILAGVLTGLDIKCSCGSRRGAGVVYVRESESIESLLALMGAGKASMEIMSVKIERDVRNRANRGVNCDSANIEKTLSAAHAQCEAIKRIKERGDFEKLPPQLRELAELRLNNAEMTLKELGICFDPPLSRSGVNHRMERIMELAREE